MTKLKQIVQNDSKTIHNFATLYNLSKPYKTLQTKQKTQNFTILYKNFTKLYKQTKTLQNCYTASHNFTQIYETLQKR